MLRHTLTLHLTSVRRLFVVACLLLGVALLGTTAPVAAQNYNVATVGTSYTSPVNQRSVTTYIFARKSQGFASGSVSLLNGSFRLVGHVTQIESGTSAFLECVVIGKGYYWEGAQILGKPCTFTLRVKRPNAAYRLGGVSAEVTLRNKQTIFLTGTQDGVTPLTMPFYCGTLGFLYFP